MRLAHALALLGAPRGIRERARCG